jgi:hypothetical protein
MPGEEAKKALAHLQPFSGYRYELQALMTKNWEWEREVSIGLTDLLEQFTELINYQGYYK